MTLFHKSVTLILADQFKLKVVIKFSFVTLLHTIKKQKTIIPTIMRN